MPRGGKADAASSSAEAAAIDWTVGALASDWEKDDVIRCRARSTDCLTKWLSPQVKGIPSMRAIELNADPLLHIANRWCTLVKEARAPPVPVLRAEDSLEKVVI